MTRTQLFNYAWTTAKNLASKNEGTTSKMWFGYALELAWKKAKETKTTKSADELIATEISRETEKAIMVRLSDGSRMHNVWFPKSQVEEVNGFYFAPAWLVNAKAKDLGVSYLNFAG